MSITPQEFADKINLQIAELQKSNRPLELAARSVHALQVQRIFKDGLKSDGSQIGQYNTTEPLYVNPSTSPGNTSGIKPPRGKNGDTHFKSGKKEGQPHKTTYVESYKAYKGLIGRNNDKVNLRLSDDLFSDFASPVFDTNNPRPEMISIHEYQSRLKRDHNSKKFEGLQFGNKSLKGYGVIGKLTSEEKKIFFQTVESELKKMFSP
jgi:hypothetical protein